MAIMKGDKRTNTVQPIGVVSTRGLMSGASNMGAAVDRLSRTVRADLEQRAEQERRGAEVKYTTQAFANEAKWYRENKDRLQNDPGVAEGEFEVRRSTTYDAAAQTLDPVALEVFNQHLTQQNTMRMDEIYAKDELNTQNDAYSGFSESLDVMFEDLSNAATKQGSLALELNGDYINLINATVEDQIDMLGYDDMRMKDGSTASDSLRAKVESKMANLYASAISKDALMELQANGEDAAFKSVNDFVENGPAQFSPEQRRAMGNVAEAGLSDAIRAESNANAEANAQNAMFREMRQQDRLDGVQDGKYGGGDLEREILSGVITDKTEISQLRTAMRAQAKADGVSNVARAEVSEMLKNKQDFSSALPAQKKVLDDIFDNGMNDPKTGEVAVPGFNLQGTPEEIMAQTPQMVSFISQTGYMPKSVVSTLESNVTAYDNIPLMKAMVGIVDQVQAKNPTILGAAKLDPQALAFYDQLSAFAMAGASPENAVKALYSHIYRPKDERERKLTNYLNGQDPDVWIAANLREQFENVAGGFFQDVFDTFPDASAAMVGDAKIIMQEVFSMYQDPQMALRATARQLDTMWGRSEFARGGDGYMRRPPEKYYRDATGSTDYIRWQAMEFYDAIKSGSMYEGQGTIFDPSLTQEEMIDSYGDRWWLTPSPESSTREKPSYNMRWRDRNGIVHTEMRMNGEYGAMEFTPDPSMSKDAKETAQIAQIWHEELKDAHPAIKAAARLVNVTGRSKNMRDLGGWLRRGNTKKVANWFLGEQEDLGEVQADLEALAKGK